MKVQNDLNQVAAAVKAGKLTEKQGMDKIVEDICENPFNYGLINFDEEFRSDLILRVLQKGTAIFRRYKPENGQFRTFLCSFIKFQIRDLLKLQRNRAITEKNIAAMFALNYEEAQEKYNKAESSLEFTEFKAYTPKKNDKAPFAPRRKFKYSDATPEEKTFIQYMGKYRKTNPVKKTALVLALKSCYYLTDEYFDYLSDFCEIPKDYLIQVVNELKESVSQREEKISKVQNARDKSFQLRNKLLEEIENQVCPEKKNELRHFYEIHNKNWESKLDTLKNTSYFPAPTNRRVADALGICERQVGYYLQKANKIVDEYLKKKNK